VATFCRKASVTTHCSRRRVRENSEIFRNFWNRENRRESDTAWEKSAASRCTNNAVRRSRTMHRLRLAGRFRPQPRYRRRSGYRIKYPVSRSKNLIRRRSVRRRPLHREATAN